MAIEFANELGLSLEGDRLLPFGMNTPNTVYTGPSFAYDWRDYHFFAQLDEAQVGAGIAMTLDICRRHDIEPSFYYPSTTFDFPRCLHVATIVCHSNCRRDKTDLALPIVYERVEGRGFGWFVREGTVAVSRQVTRAHLSTALRRLPTMKDGRVRRQNQFDFALPDLRTHSHSSIPGRATSAANKLAYF